eukprot:3581093-Prorocentrum_lima.AAC.1
MLEQKWQEWVVQRNPRTPTLQQPPLEADIARALESMERKMSMLEPSLKYLAELKGKNATLSKE